MTLRRTSELTARLSLCCAVLAPDAENDPGQIQFERIVPVSPSSCAAARSQARPLHGRPARFPKIEDCSFFQRNEIFSNCWNRANMRLLPRIATLPPLSLSAYMGRNRQPLPVAISGPNCVQGPHFSQVRVCLRGFLRAGARQWVRRMAGVRIRRGRKAAPASGASRQRRAA